MKRNRENTKSSLHQLSEEVSAAITSSGGNQQKSLRDCLSRAFDLDVQSTNEVGVTDVTRQQISRIFRLLVQKCQFVDTEALDFFKAFILPNCLSVESASDDHLNLLISDVTYFSQCVGKGDLTFELLRCADTLTKISDGEVDYPFYVGKGLRLPNAQSRLVFLKIFLGLLPVMKCQADDACSMAAVLNALSLTVKERWGWFIELMPSTPTWALTLGTIQTLWHQLWGREWRGAEAEVTIVAHRLLISTEQSLRSALVASFPTELFQSCLNFSDSDELILCLKGHPDVRLLKEQFLQQSASHGVVTRLFADAQEFISILISLSLAVERCLLLCGWYTTVYGKPLPHTMAMHIKSVLPTLGNSDEGLWLLSQVAIQFEGKDDALAVLNDVPFCPHLIPVFLKWDLTRPTLWGDDLDTLFSLQNQVLASNLLRSVAAYAEASVLLGAFARNKRRMHPSVFVDMLSTISALKHESSTLTAVSSSTGLDARAAALTLWHNPSLTDWDSIMDKGLVDQSEGIAWAMAAACRLFVATADTFTKNWDAKITSAVLDAMLKINFPLSLRSIDNVLQLVSTMDLDNHFLQCIGAASDDSLASARSYSSSSEENIIEELVQVLVETKRPSQTAGFATVASKYGIDLNKIPQFLHRIRLQLILQVLFRKNYTNEILSLAFGLSLCEGDSKQWVLGAKRNAALARSTILQMTFEVLDKIGEKLTKGKQSLMKDALTLRALLNFIQFLGEDVLTSAVKLQSLLCCKRSVPALHCVALEGAQQLILYMSADSLVQRGDGLVADLLDMLSNIRNPETYRIWIRVMKGLHSKAPSATYWKPVFTELILPPALSSAISASTPSLDDALSASVTLLGTASHAFRRMLLKGLIDRLRGNATSIGKLAPHAALLMKNLLDSVQVPLLSTLSCELMGIIGPIACARANVTSTTSVEEVLEQSLEWRQFVFATLSQHCLSAIDAAASAAAQDQISFVLQEVIRAGCEEERKSNAKLGNYTRAELDGYSWWAPLPHKQRDRYQVFTTTNYSVPEAVPNKWSKPIFSQGMSPTIWCRVLSKALADSAQGPFQRLFRATRALAVADRNRMYDLLPVFSLHNVLNSTEVGPLLAKEISIVCELGDREHVMVALSVVDTLQRAAQRVLLSEKLAKFKLKFVEAFPYCSRVANVLKEIHLPTVIAAAVRCGFDAHAIRSLEAARVMPKVSDLSEAEVSTVKKAFSHLYDPESVRAVRELAYPCIPTCEDLALENDHGGAMRFASTQLSEGDDANVALSFSRCAEFAGFPGSAMAALEGYKGERTAEMQHQINEASWRLGRWDEIKPTSTPSFATPLQALFMAKVSAVSQQMSNVSAVLSTMAGHIDNVPDQLLVALNGLEDVRYLEKNLGDTQSIVKYLNARMAQSWQFRNPEPIRWLHCQFYKYLSLPNATGDLWLGQTRHSLLHKDYDGAIAAARRVGSLGLKDEFNSEMTSILAKMDRKTEAIQFALHAIPSVSLECASRLKAQAALWGHELNFHTPPQTVALLSEAVKDHGSSDSFEMFGLFHYKMFSNARSTIESSTGPNRIKDMHHTMESHALPGITAFSKAVTLDAKHTVEAIPRLVTMWLDGNATLYQTLKEGRLRGFDPERLTNETNTLVSKLPPTYFLASVSHLLSRLTANETAPAVSTLILKLLQVYPQPLLWQVLAAGYSTPTSRVTTIQNRILAPYVEGGGRDTMTQFKTLFACLTQICRNVIPNNKLTAFDPVKKLVPHLSQAKFVIPTIRSLHPSYSTRKSSFYFDSVPHIVSFGEQVDVINSLQKPKRIVIIDSSGTSHFYLMKSKDDPRKDIRMMEIATHMNNVFLQSATSSSEALYLQRYAVMALCDDCALIEWIDATATARKILDECYMIDGTGVKISEVQTWKDACDKGRFSKHDLFTKHIFPASRPILHQWFQRSFPHTLQWYRARNLYVQSTAVWSMCGHMLGLGDRHAENLLLSLDSGQAIHVDFACMFDKGETLRVPETVRFRLTPNVVDGFGLTGVNGPFANCCEKALTVLAANKDILEGVLETFIYDPLLEWASKESRTDPKALIRRCKRRLDGHMDFNGVLDEAPLSVAGQVRALINHSSKLEVLSEMYIWWMIWL